MWISQIIYSNIIAGFLLVAGSEEKEIQLDVLGNTASKDACHYTLQIRNYLNSNIDKLTIRLTAVDNFRSKIGVAIFEAKNLAELQPYVRAITMKISNDAKKLKLKCQDTRFLEVSIGYCFIKNVNEKILCDKAITTKNKDKDIKIVRSSMLPPIVENKDIKEIIIKDIGIKVKKINRNLAHMYNLQVETQGLIVTYVNKPDLLLDIGDIILEASFFPTIDPYTLQKTIADKKLSKNNSIILTIIRNSEEQWIAIPLK